MSAAPFDLSAMQAAMAAVKSSGVDLSWVNKGVVPKESQPTAHAQSGAQSLPKVATTAATAER